MAWVTLTEDDLKSALTAQEREDFGTAGADGSPADRVPQILSDLIAEVRGYIASWTQNTLSADETKIPGSMRAQALSVARYRLLITVAGYQPGEAREKEYAEAMKYFANVAKGIIRPEKADDAVTPEVPPEKPAGAEFCSRPLRTGYRNMDGL